MFSVSFEFYLDEPERLRDNLTALHIVTSGDE